MCCKRKHLQIAMYEIMNILCIQSVFSTEVIKGIKIVNLVIANQQGYSIGI